MPSKKLLSAFGKGGRGVPKGKKKNTLPIASSSSISSAPKNGPSASKVEDDPVKMMQDRMLHRAMHSRSGAMAYTAPTSFPTRAQLADKKASQRKITPPRGTLSDEKLPYLDWRLSMLHLEQVKVDEHKLALRRAHHEGRIFAVESQSQSQARSLIVEATGSDSSAGSRCDTELSSRKLSNAIERPIAVVHSQHTASIMDAWQQQSNDMVPVSIDLEQGLYFSKQAAYCGDTDVLAGVPVLSRGVLERGLRAGGQHRGQIDIDSEEYLDDDDDEDDDDETSSNEEYYDAADRRDDSLVSLSASVPAELPGDSLIQRSDSSGSNASSKRKIATFFSRGSRNRPVLPNRSQSHGCLEEVSHGNNNIAVKDIYYEPAKAKKKWSLLALNQMAIREADTFR